MRTSFLALAFAGCAGAPAPAPVAVAPPPVAVDFEIRGVDDHTHPMTSGTAGVTAETPARRNQSPEVKLKLGHYSNSQIGIGLVIDRTGDKVAKVRFDGTDQTIDLKPQYFWHRTEYHRAANEKLLEVRNDGDIRLHMPGIGERGAWLFRDGDADPL